MSPSQSLIATSLGGSKFYRESGRKSIKTPKTNTRAETMRVNVPSEIRCSR